jgi:hypothetical protein
MSFPNKKLLVSERQLFQSSHQLLPGRAEFKACPNPPNSNAELLLSTNLAGTENLIRNLRQNCQLLYSNFKNWPQIYTAAQNSFCPFCVLKPKILAPWHH